MLTLGVKLYQSGRAMAGPFPTKSLVSSLESILVIQLPACA
jgi:hypothetical protein